MLVFLQLEGLELNRIYLMNKDVEPTRFVRKETQF